MTYKPYWEKLRDPRWQKKRLKILNAANFKCQECGADERTLHVHHSYYEKGREPWDYPDHSLSCLCDTCHTDTEELLASIHRRFAGLRIHDLSEIYEIVSEISRERKAWRKRATAMADDVCEYHN